MSKDTNPITEQQLVDKARESLADHRLPDDVERRLRLARAEAIEHMENRRPWFDALLGGHRWVVPAGAAATLALAVTLVDSNQPDVMPLMNEQELAAASDMELLDDIEFLAWMLEEDTREDSLDDG